MVSINYLSNLTNLLVKDKDIPTKNDLRFRRSYSIQFIRFL